MADYLTHALVVTSETTACHAAEMARVILDSANLALRDILSGSPLGIDEQRALYGILYNSENAEKLVEHVHATLQQESAARRARSTRTLGEVMADAYELGTVDMAVIEGFLRAQRGSRLDIEPASLRASDDAKLRATWWGEK